MLKVLGSTYSTERKGGRKGEGRKREMKEGGRGEEERKGGRETEREGREGERANKQAELRMEPVIQEP